MIPAFVIEDERRRKRAREEAERPFASIEIPVEPARPEAPRKEPARPVVIELLTRGGGRFEEG